MWTRGDTTDFWSFAFPLTFDQRCRTAVFSWGFLRLACNVDGLSEHHGCVLVKESAFGSFSQKWLVISRIRNESIFSLFFIYRPSKGKSLKGNILEICYNFLFIFHCGPSFKGHQVCRCQAYGDVLALEHLINASARGGMKWQRWDRQIGVMDPAVTKLMNWWLIMVAVHNNINTNTLMIIMIMIIMIMIMITII